MSRVKRTQADRVNQKLYFAKLAIQTIVTLENDPDCSVQMLQMHTENAVLHCQGALFAYYQELSYYYALALHHPTLDSITQALAVQNRVSPELAIIGRNLDTGFLAALQRAYHNCLYQPKPSEPQAEELIDSAGIIALHRVSDSALPCSVDLQQWLNQLKALIEHFRDEQVEF